jgi:hypothetical protein
MCINILYKIIIDNKISKFMIILMSMIEFYVIVKLFIYIIIMIIRT